MKRSSISSTAVRLAVAIAVITPAAALAQNEAQRSNAQDAAKRNASAPAAKEFTQAELVGKTLYDRGEQKIGEIAGVLHGSDGKPRAVLVDVGGFLGLGEKKVAVAMEQIRRGAGGGFVAADLTRQQAQNMQEYRPEEFNQSVR